MVECYPFSLEHLSKVKFIIPWDTDLSVNLLWSSLSYSMQVIWFKNLVLWNTLFLFKFHILCPKEYATQKELYMYHYVSNKIENTEYGILQI